MTDLRQYLLNEHHRVYTLNEPVSIEMTHTVNRAPVSKVYQVKEVWPKTPVPGIPFRHVKSWK